MFGNLAVVARVLWNKSGCLSVGPSFCSFTLPPCLSVVSSSIFSFFLNFGMVPETYLKLCVIELEKFSFYPRIGEIGQKQGFIEKSVHYFFFWNCYIIKFLLYTVFLLKSHISENFCSSDMYQNVFSQSECRNI